ncbi:MAG: hypothetical protein SVV67_00400 [Bacillota bacterium]|nr:hypothetical protein [Bacillota bacterium]
MNKSQYEEYIHRDIQLHVHPHEDEVEYPVMAMKTLEDYGNHGCALSWWPISKPMAMVKDTHSHDFDQYLMFIGGDLTNMNDLGGEVELTIGLPGKKLEVIKFTTATTFYIPAGMLHGPLYFKKINDPNKPILFHDFFFATEYSRKVESE